MTDVSNHIFVMTCQSLNPVPNTVRTLRMLVLILLMPCAFAATFAQSAGSDQRQPVLVELFTSEGCSDCPPADALLARLDATQFVPGAHAIVLSEHVTYWNQLGWRDPFSSEAMTARQEQYVRGFGLDSAYTPQMVVDGAVQFVGSRADELENAVAREAATPKLAISLEEAHWTANAVHFAVRTHLPPHTALYVALAQDATRSEVAHGENAGRTLHHVAVVRVLKEYGAKATDGEPLQLSTVEKMVGPLRLVAFVASGRDGHVLGAAEQTLTR